MTSILKRLIVAALMLVAVPMAAPVQAQVAGTAPLYLPIARFGLNGADIAPGDVIVTSEEERRLLSSVRAMTFPRYLYSGCDDRAHAAYLLLPADLRPKMMKIWVVTTSKYTSAIRGSITSTRQEPAYRAVDWGFHVALAYRTATGLKIVDPALRPGEVIGEADWFLEMTVSPLSFWTLTRGSVYQFYPSAKDSYALNGQHWTGNSYDYSGTSRTENWIPSALARDAIGADAIAGTTCPLLRGLATDPTTLLDELNKGSTDPTNACRSSIDKYRTERTRWMTLINGPG